MQDETRLSVRGLHMRYPSGVHAVRGIDLDVRAGELLVVLGGNGCGKSTLLRCITRGLRPSAGELWLARDDWSRDRRKSESRAQTKSGSGMAVSDPSHPALDGCDLAALEGEALRRARQRMAMIWQQASLVRRRSVLANVACGALARHNTLWTNLGGLPAAEMPAALACLREVGLEHLAARRAGTLSGGQAQRVAIARALLQRPAVLLADEPVASLDPEAAHDIMRLLRRLAHRDNLAVLCVLHQIDLAFAFADRIVGMRQGEIMFDRPRPHLAPGDVSHLYAARAA